MDADRRDKSWTASLYWFTGGASKTGGLTPGHHNYIMVKEILHIYAPEACAIIKGKNCIVCTLRQGPLIESNYISFWWMVDLLYIRWWPFQMITIINDNINQFGAPLLTWWSTFTLLFRNYFTLMLSPLFPHYQKVLVIFFSYLRNLRAPASKRMKDWKGQRAIQRKRKREDRKELESFCRWFNNISMHVSYTVKFEFMHFCFFSYGKFKSASNTKTIKRHTWHYYLFNLVPLYFYTSDTFWCVPVHHTDA